MKKILAGLILISGLFFPYGWGSAQEKEIGPPIPLISVPGCAPHAAIKQQLRENYHEIPVIIGVSNVNNLMTIYASSLKDGSFTIVVTRPGSEKSCIVGAGTSFHMILAPLGIDSSYKP